MLTIGHDIKDVRSITPASPFGTPFLICLKIGHIFRLLLDPSLNISILFFLLAQ